MEVMVAAASPSGSPTRDHFNFMPYLSAPSSPKRFGEDFYLSAPTSPSSFYTQFDYFSNLDGDCDGGDDGFAFAVGGGSETPSRSAEELFDGGKIKPLLESSRTPLLSPRRSSPLAKGKKAVIEAFSPRRKKEAERDGGGEERRGRDRTPAGADSSSSASKSGRRVTRSLSPYRVSHYTWEEEHQIQQSHQRRSNKEDSDSNSVPATAAASSSSLSSTTSKGSGRKWRLRDFLLFRSASEGRGSSTDPLRKFHLFYKKGEEVKASSTSTSFRGSETPRLRRKEPVSAHELHYARKRAETEDLKKRTFLPYKQGILGRLAGLGSITR